MRSKEAKLGSVAVKERVCQSIIDAIDSVDMPQPDSEWLKERVIVVTKRELATIYWVVVQGLTPEEAAKTKLFISKRTVDYRLSKLYKKLQVGNRIAAYRRLLALGFKILEPEEE